MSQHMDALARGNEIRIARCKLKREIAAGETTVQRVMSDPPVEVQTMPLSALLMAQHRWGVLRSNQFLGRVQVSPMKRVGDLTARQRGEIIDHLDRPDWYGRWAA